MSVLVSLAYTKNTFS